jgi:KDO2-lipid IV(A) lauroyltransferase
MSSSLVVWLFDLAARLPLGVLHRLGTGLGWAAYLFSGTYARRLRENLGRALKSHAGAATRTILLANVAEAGKSMAELPWVWRRPVDQVLSSVQACHGWEHVEAAYACGKGVIILTPHLGCFEIIGLYVPARMPLTSMYRPPKLAWLDEVMCEGRRRGQMQLARTDVGGVRTLFKALKRGEAICLLPDQVPGNGEGEWADFFGRTAYTMTLAGRLMESTGASAVMSYVERLPEGKGYIIRFAPLSLDRGTPVTRQINAALEDVVRSCPAQYLWSYNRYKVPSGVGSPQPGNEG